MNTKVKTQSDLSGVFGESISFTKKGGKVIAKNRPKIKITADPSEKQLAVKAKFLEAAQYATRQIEQPEIKKLYTKGISPTNRSAYSVAMRDWLVAPKVSEINTTDYAGKVGDVIIVKATDDFMVTRVKVSITNSSGKVIEQGEAQVDPETGFLWTYKATVANSGLIGTKILAVAFDRPKNTGSLEKVLV